MSSIKICPHCNIPFKYDWHVEYNTCPDCGCDKSDNVVDTEIGNTPTQLRQEFENIIKNQTNSNVEFLLESNNSNYIKWLEEKILNK